MIPEQNQDGGVCISYFYILFKKNNKKRFVVGWLELKEPITVFGSSQETETSPTSRGNEKKKSL